MSDNKTLARHQWPDSRHHGNLPRKNDKPQPDDSWPLSSIQQPCQIAHSPPKTLNRKYNRLKINKLIFQNLEKGGIFPAFSSVFPAFSSFFPGFSSFFPEFSSFFQNFPDVFRRCWCSSPTTSRTAGNAWLIFRRCWCSSPTTARTAGNAWLIPIEH